MKKKTTPYEFKNSTFDFLLDVDIKPKKHKIVSVYENYNTNKKDVSPDILKLMKDDDFHSELYEFVKNYNEKYKTLKMKKEHQTYNEYFDKLEALVTIGLEVRNGEGSVGYFPLLEHENEYEKKMWGDFKIKKVDMMKFINDFSKKKKFNPNTEVDEFKRVGNWYTLEIDNTKYNVIIQKDSNSFNCDSSSIIVFNDFVEDIKYISPVRDRKNIYDKIETIMDKVDFKYDVVDEE